MLAVLMRSFMRLRCGERYCLDGWLLCGGGGGGGGAWPGKFAGLYSSSWYAADSVRDSEGVGLPKP
jgi:hypothetical protein